MSRARQSGSLPHLKVHSLAVPPTQTQRSPDTAQHTKGTQLKSPQSASVTVPSTVTSENLIEVVFSMSPTVRFCSVSFCHVTSFCSSVLINRMFVSLPAACTHTHTLTHTCTHFPAHVTESCAFCNSQHICRRPLPHHTPMRRHYTHTHTLTHSLTHTHTPLQATITAQQQQEEATDKATTSLKTSTVVILSGHLSLTHSLSLATPIPA